MKLLQKTKKCKYLCVCICVGNLYFLCGDGSSKVANFLRRGQGSRIYGILPYGGNFLNFPIF